MVWTNEKCILLIMHYEKEIVLWNQKYENYFNKNLKQDAWRRLSEAVQEDVEEVKKKMKALLGSYSYRREKSRQKKSKITGSGTDNIYTSKWFAYDYFNFLSDKDDPRDTIDTMEMEETLHTEEVQVEYIEEIENIDRECERERADLSGTNSLSTFTTPAITKKTSASVQPGKAKAVKRKADPLLDEAMDILRKCSKKSDERSDDLLTSYGIYISNELRKYDRMTVANIKHDINNILYAAECGYYSSDQHGYYSRPSTSTSQYSYTAQSPESPPQLATSPPLSFTSSQTLPTQTQTHSTCLRTPLPPTAPPPPPPPPTQ